MVSVGVRFSRTKRRKALPRFAPPSAVSQPQVACAPPSWSARYDKDTKGSGKSSCTGPCLAAWPPVAATGTPKTSGISGTVGTITTADGKKQVTLGGWPLYYYAGDGAAGDVNGQGSQGIWWVLTAKGTRVTAAPSAAGAAGSYGRKGGYGSY